MLRSETAAQPERTAAALAGLAAYQAAVRPHPGPPLPIHHRQGRASLRLAGGAGPPVVLVPSPINPPSILDLAPDRSLVRWLATQGRTVWLVDWGTPTPDDRGLDLDGHVEQLLMPMLRALPAPPVLVGYCLGGTLAWRTAAAMPIGGVATIAAPWHFTGYGEPAREAMTDMWAGARASCAAMGLVPMELLQAGFWRLDPARTIAKYEAFGRMDPAGDQAAAFVRLEDWSNAGAPLTFAAGRQLFEDFVGADVPGRGGWQLARHAVDPRALGCPTVEFVSATDRIVPAASAAGLADARVLTAGHVGMVVGGRALNALWRPLADWIGGVATDSVLARGAF